VLKGVPNNLEFLRVLVEDPRFAAGDTTTKFLENFNFAPHVVEVVLPGAHGVWPEQQGGTSLVWMDGVLQQTPLLAGTVSIHHLTLMLMLHPTQTQACKLRCRTGPAV
jgi:hypothetical protein